MQKEHARCVALVSDISLQEYGLLKCKFGAETRAKTTALLQLCATFAGEIQRDEYVAPGRFQTDILVSRRAKTFDELVQCADDLGQVTSRKAGERSLAELGCKSDSPVRKASEVRPRKKRELPLLRPTREASILGAFLEKIGEDFGSTLAQSCEKHADGHDGFWRRSRAPKDSAGDPIGTEQGEGAENQHYANFPDFSVWVRPEQQSREHQGGEGAVHVNEESCADFEPREEPFRLGRGKQRSAKEAEQNEDGNDADEQS